MPCCRLLCSQRPGLLGSIKGAREGEEWNRPPSCVFRGRWLGAGWLARDAGEERLIPMLRVPIPSQGLWTSPKHDGRMVSIASPRVLVLTNETLDRSRLTEDRWHMFETGVDMPTDRTVDRQFQPQTVEQMRQQCQEERDDAQLASMDVG